MGNIKPKKVAQFTLDGEYIRTYDSMWQANKETGISANGISKCCLMKDKMAGKKGGTPFRWLFEEDVPRAKEIFEQYPIVRRSVYYTDEELLEEVMKYKTTTELRKHSRMYSAIKNRKLVLPIGRDVAPYEDKCYFIYAYEFPETKTVYVGLTFRWDGRQNQHRYEEKSPVNKYAKKNNVPFPEPKCVENNLTVYEVGDREDYWKKWYKAQGWNVLNKGATGKNASSIGSVRRVRSKTIIETAGQYVYLSDFAKEHPNLYQIAKKRNIELGLVKKCLPNGALNEEHCYNVARGYKRVKDLKNEQEGVYARAVCNGWDESYWWLENKKKRMVIVSNGFLIKAYNSADILAEEINENKQKIYNIIHSGVKLNGCSIRFFDISECEFKIPDFEHRIIV